MVLAGTQCGNCLRLAGEKAQQASSRTAQAQMNINKLETLLKDAIANDYRFNWQSLQKDFHVPPPQVEPEPSPSPVPILVRVAKLLPILENILPPLLRLRLKWDEACEAEKLKRSVAADRYTHALDDWKKSKELFLKEQASEVERKQRLYQSKDRDALVDYWTKILERPIYLEKPPCVRQLDFFEANDRLIVEYALPQINLLPKVEEVRYLERENVLMEVPVSDARLNSLYSDLLIKMALIALFKLFQSDVANSLRSVAFNGTVNIIDPATGREINPCVIAVAAENSAFMEMNLSLIDPVACFKRLKGRISENLGELSPIDPIT